MRTFFGKIRELLRSNFFTGRKLDSTTGDSTEAPPIFINILSGLEFLRSPLGIFRKLSSQQCVLADLLLLPSAKESSPEFFYGASLSAPRGFPPASFFFLARKLQFFNKSSATVRLPNALPVPWQGESSNPRLRRGVFLLVIFFFSRKLQFFNKSIATVQLPNALPVPWQEESSNQFSDCDIFYIHYLHFNSTIAKCIVGCLDKKNRPIF